jgi:hypothetical protein
VNDSAVAGECLQAFRDGTGDEDDTVGARLIARFLIQIDKFLNS